jgi:ABC-type multidrug transport system fused ATPase/permease subunit
MTNLKFIVPSLAGWSLLDGRARKYVTLLFFAGLFGVFTEITGIASILPFMRIVAQPEIIHRNHWLKLIYNSSHAQNDYQFILLVGMASFLFFVGGNLYSALFLFLGQRYLAWQRLSLSRYILTETLQRPYLVNLTAGANPTVRAIMSEVSVFSNGILAGIRLSSRVFLLLCIVIAILVVDPFTASICILLFGGSYALTYTMLKGGVTRNAKIRTNAEGLSYKFLYEGLTSLREVRLWNCEEWASSRMLMAAKTSLDAQTYISTVQELPRYIIESIAFSGLIAVILYMVKAGFDVALLLPKISLISVAAYRMIGAMQQAFGNLAQYQMSLPAADYLRQEMLTFRKNSEHPQQDRFENIEFRSFEFEKVRFSYPNSSKIVFKELSIKIEANTTVGFIGSTGAGKSTLAAMILGLISPDSGTIKMNDVRLDFSNLSSWQRLIGYVPQDIVILDAPLSQNVAFGLTAESVEPHLVEQACKLASIDMFIENELPDGYETILGERGLRLSGGQRQRLAIARALYRQPSILILDEATSALDGATEATVMQSIRSLAHRKTIVLIAHRLTTLAECDVIYVLKEGSIVSMGSYEELQSNAHFLELTLGVPSPTPVMVSTQ